MRTRRGIASVVGMVFAIIALTTTIAYISYSMGILNNFNQSVLVKNQQLTDVDKEKFQISSVTVPNGKLDVTVANTGSLPIQFTKMWIQNTTTTDWVNSYVPTNNFVAPGGVLTNIGQNIPVFVNQSNSYNVKLVTSRGNFQQFFVNSPNTAPLNLQLMAMPPTVPSGFKSQLVLIVTNNSTGTLINVSPQTPSLVSSNATSCNLGTVSPAKIGTLSPGGSVVFSWPITITGATNTNCAYQAQLKNGYPGQSVQATVAVAAVSVSQNSINSAIASAAGLVTLEYESFRWTQGNNWQSGWTLNGNTNTGFYLNMTNNNSTGGGTTLWLSQHSEIFFFVVEYPGNAQKNNQPFSIVGTIKPGPSPSLSDTSYGSSCSNGDYCLSLPYNKTTTVFFAATGPNNSNFNQLASGSDYIGFVVITGSFSNNKYGVGGTGYAQTIPFIGITTP
ncbi:MAG: hypothetical protein KGH88_01130 [Thaumarchaeota archaeon]|nr:hypothetical protein [Nitrososphaerota archaeon]